MWISKAQKSGFFGHVLGRLQSAVFGVVLLAAGCGQGPAEVSAEDPTGVVTGQVGTASNQDEPFDVMGRQRPSLVSSKTYYRTGPDGFHYKRNAIALAQNYNDRSLKDFMSDGLGPDSNSGNLLNVPIGNEWMPIAQCDFNGDGTPDILWRHQDTFEIVLWTVSNRRLTNASLIVDGNQNPLRLAPSGWQVQGCGNVDGSGRASVLWMYQPTGDLARWRFNDAGQIDTANTGVFGPAAKDWIIADVADADRDGTDDILWVQRVSGAVVVWYMKSGSFSRGTVATLNVGPQPAEYPNARRFPAFSGLGVPTGPVNGIVVVPSVYRDFRGPYPTTDGQVYPIP